MKLYSGIIFLVCISSLIGADDESTSTLLPPSSSDTPSSTEMPPTSVKPTSKPEPSPTTTPAKPTPKPEPSPTSPPTIAPTSSDVPSTTTPPVTTPGDVTTSTKVAPISTTPVPPTSTPAPAPGTWKVEENNKTCIMARMEVEYVMKNSSLNHYLSPNASSSGSSCSNVSQILVLVDGEGDNEYMLTFIFVKSDKGQVYVQNISAKYPTAESEVQVSGSYFSVSKDKSYKCISKIDVAINANFTLRFTQMQLEAFDVPNGNFKDADVCMADVKKDDPITIGVAIALVLLVIIVLGSYLGFRYRNNQRGYDTF